MTSVLTVQDCEKIVGLYLCRSDLSDDDGPVDDFRRLVAINHAVQIEIGRSVSLDRLLPLIHESKSNSLGRSQRFVMKCAEILHAITPDISNERWIFIFGSILARRYGGTKFYIKREPKKKLLAAAKVMNAEELMVAHGISRRYAYQLRKESLTKK